MIPVAANDVAFSIHAVVLTAFTLFQIAIYDVSVHWFLLNDITNLFDMKCWWILKDI